MTLRRTIRLGSCLALLTLGACAAAGAPPSVRPNEVQVVEPAGKAELWTFSPAELAIAKGTTVTFVNRGKEFHTITSDSPGRPFDLGLDSGTRGTVTFAEVGVYPYHCGVHPQMKGVVRVCDGPCR